MSLIDKLEFCHCELNRNLNELVRAVQGGRDAAVLGCGEVRPVRSREAERYARALEAWLASSDPAPEVADEFQTVSSLLGRRDGRKDELVGHLIARLGDNGYEFYSAEEEDFETPDSRIQHLEICCFNWAQDLVILLDEIGRGERSHGWHGVGLFCACGDVDPNNCYPATINARLESVTVRDETLFDQLRIRLREASPDNAQLPH